MSGEYQPTVTGDRIARVTFSPEASGYQVTGVPVGENLAKAVQTAMMLELAVARARVLELESERDGLIAAQPGDAVEFEADRVPGAEAEVYARAAGTLAGSATDSLAPDAAATEPEAPAVSSSPDELETSPPPAPPENAAGDDKGEAETKTSRNELRRLSQISQAEILREIIMHEDFVVAGRLDAANVSGIIKKKVQARTGMSDQQWRNAYNILQQKKLISLCPYDDNPKKSYAVIIDMELLAEFIEKSKLFAREEDEIFKEYFTELTGKQAKPSDAVDAAVTSPGAKAGLEASAAARAIPRPPSARSAPPVAAPKPPAPAAPYQMSTKQRKQLEYEERERLGRDAAALRDAHPDVRRLERRSFVDDLVGPAEVIVPKYAEVTEEEWEVITEDDVRFLLALSSDIVKAVDSPKSDQLLLAIVEAGRINANDGSGVYDPKIMSSIIKDLRLPPRPKIVFSQPGGKVKLELTKAGEEYLAIQFRKVKLAVTRAREARPKVA